MRLAVLTSLAAVMAAPATAQPGAWAGSASPAGVVYETGFEEFSLGSIGDQHGWVGINGAFTISTANEHGGTQHFRGTSTGGAWSFARSPFVDPAADIAEVSAWISLGNSTAPAWEFTPGVANQGAITTVRFRADRSIDVLVSSPIPEGTFVPTGASAPAGYFRLDVTIEVATGAFEVFLDGASIATGQGLRPGGLMALIVYSEMPAGTAGHTFDMDDLSIGGAVTPAIEPSPDGSLVSAPRPTPFSGRASLDVTLETPQHVVATLFDPTGRRVAVLHDGPMPAGRPHRLTIDGAGLRPGVYLLRVQGQTFTATRRLVRAR